MRRINRTHWFVSVAVLAAQHATFILLLHHSRFAAVSGGSRYIPSTAFALSEIIKFTISLTGALYEVSKPAAPSMSVTSLFSTLASRVLRGDSWKMAFPALSYAASNSLLYLALSNLDAAAFQIAYQLQLVISAALGYIVLRRTVSQERCITLILLVAGIIMTLWHRAQDTYELDEKRSSTGPRSVLEFKRVGTAMGGTFMKRSATYEGMNEDLMMAYPDMNTKLGLMATLSAAFTSALGGVSFEKIVGESMDATSMWIRNVQLSMYTLAMIGFFGIGTVDAEQISKQGFFGGYNWTVWTVVGLQASLGLGTAICYGSGQICRKACATRFSSAIILMTSMRLSGFPDNTMAIIGSSIVLVSIFFYGPLKPPSTAGGSAPLPLYAPVARRPSSLAPYHHEKADDDEVLKKTDSRHLTVPTSDDRFLRIPTTPELERQGVLSTSRPASPMARTNHAKTGYFDQ
ncbi:Chromatin structure remodeling complex protein sfh1 [Ascosphaera pollenicola]|nr:Chromatin structure remodeling complex protein sfh1 [Ascosphaera pollenicola]